ncbi:hypothetical protein B0H11DRAFT_2237426 [Mycena galericulata]|nr:hypothetical protein B0H11DRAFT_2237426 [Mycena galericulata]
MTFATDASWPVRLLRIFDIARTIHRYHGAYTKLLTYCFGEDFDLVVAPQVPPTENSRETVDSTFYFIVFDVAHQSPVFLIEVKDDGHNLFPTTRKAADEQMRRVLGTGMRVYCGDKARQTVTPPFVETDRHFVLPNGYLQDQWSVDILSPRGFSEMKWIVAFVKDASAKL